MEASIFTNTHLQILGASLPKGRIKNPAVSMRPPTVPQLKLRGRRAVLRCESMAAELERELDSEMEGWKEMVEGWAEKCKCQGQGGPVEMLECLEREAIMGEDEGKDPNDYNRRARIFDKSSKVFQALKERGMASSSSPKEP